MTVFFGMHDMNNVDQAVTRRVSKIITHPGTIKRPFSWVDLKIFIKNSIDPLTTQMILPFCDLTLPSILTKKSVPYAFRTRMSVSKKVRQLKSRADIYLTILTIRCALCRNWLGFDGLLRYYLGFINTPRGRRSRHFKWKMQNLPRLLRQAPGFNDLCRI